MEGVLKPTNWLYYYMVVGHTPNSLVPGVFVDYVEGHEAALDVGAGNFRDSLYLLREARFPRVVAVDPFIDVPPTPDGIEFLNLSLEDLEFPPDTFDYIICCNTLFYVSAEIILKFLKQTCIWLRPGGVMACNFYGERDDDAIRGSAGGYLTKQAVEALSGYLPVIQCQEFETCKAGSNGEVKHWHTWTLVLKKPKD